MNRTEVIRALVAGVQASGIALTDYGSEGNIVAAIQKHLQGVKGI